MSFIQQFFTSRDNNANAETFVGQEGRLWWDPITNQIYSSDGNTPGGIPLAGGGGGNGTPGGTNTAVQFNNSGNFGGTSSFTYNVSTGVLTIAGNVSAEYFLGDGSQLTNLPVTYSNTNVADYLPTYTGNLVALTGNVTTTANITGNYILGNGSQLTGITTTYGNANVAAYLPTYNGNLNPNFINASGNLDVDGSTTIGGNLFVTGNINFSGNVNQISGNSGSFFGNAAGVGALYAGVPVGYSNVVTAVIQATSDLNDYTQINAQNLNHGNTASMEYVITADIGTDTTNYLDMGVAGSGWDGTQTNSLGNAVAALDGWLYVQGGTSGGNLILGTTSAGKTIKFNAGGPDLQNTIAVISNTGFSTSGNVTGSYILGNGSQLTGIVSSYGNANVATYLASGTDTANIITTGNIRGGNISTGNITANNLPLNANANIFSSGTSSIQVATVTATSQISSVGSVRAATIMSAVGNVTGGNLTTAGQVLATGNITSAANIRAGNISAVGSIDLGGVISAVGNITGGNLLTGANVSAFGNVTGGNIITGGVITTVSNVVANYFVGNGAALTNITGANVTGTVASATAATTAGTVTTAAQPNITSVGTLTSVTSTGNISTTGNVSGNYFIGNGSLLTGIATSTYSNANVAAYLPTYAGNVAGAYFIGNGYTLTNINASNITGTVANATYADTANASTYAFNLNGGTAGALVAQNGAGATGFITIAAANTILVSNGSSPAWTLPGSIAVGTVTANAQPNITSVGTLTSVTVTGNVTGGNILTGGIISSTGNATVANISATIGAFTTFTSAQGGSVTGTLIATSANAQFINQTNPVGYATVAGYLSVAGNVTGGNILTGGLISATGNITGGNIMGGANVNATTHTGTTASLSGNVTGGNLLTAGLISATSSTNSLNLVTRNGDANPVNSKTQIAMGFNGTTDYPQFVHTRHNAGSTLYNTIELWTSDGTQAGTFPANAVLGLTVMAGRVSVGNSIINPGNALDVGGNVYTTGNITSAANIAGGNIIGTHVGNLTGTTASLSGNVTGGNVLSNGQLSTAGNITGGNLTVGGAITAIGNISASYVTGAYYTGTWSTNFQALGNISTVGNVVSGNVLNTGIMSSTGNVTGGNLITAGAVYSNYNTNTANTGSFMAQGGNTKGGTGYLDFLVAQNTSGGATNPYKWFRTTSDGQLQIINSAYTQNIFNLTDAGNVAIPGQIFINGAQTTNGPAFSAYAAAILQTIPNNTQTKVLFQTEEYDTNSNYASSRFTPTVAGYYQLNAEVRLDGSSGTGEMMIILYKNGSEYKRGTNQSGTQIASNFWAMQVSSVAYANGVGDYFEIYVQQGSGGDRTVTAVNNTAITWFNGCMLRGA